MPSQEKPHRRQATRWDGTRCERGRAPPPLPHHLPDPLQSPQPPRRAPSPPIHHGGSAGVSSFAPAWVGGGGIGASGTPRSQRVGGCRSSPVPPKPHSVLFTGKQLKPSGKISQAWRTWRTGRSFPAPLWGAQRHPHTNPARCY